LRGHNGREAPVEHFAEDVDYLGADSGVAFRKRVSAKQHHGPGLGYGKRFAHANRVGSNQVDLELANLVGGNAHVGELAHAGGNGIGNLVIGDQGVYDGAGLVHGRAGSRIEQHRSAGDCDLLYFFQCEVVSVDV
jgi:uncharacterized RmlC-like cupin family protein